MLHKGPDVLPSPVETILTTGVGVGGYVQTPAEPAASSCRRSLQSSTPVEEVREVLSYLIPTDTEATSLQLAAEVPPAPEIPLAPEIPSRSEAVVVRRKRIAVNTPHCT